MGESNSRPLRPKRRIMPLDQSPTLVLGKHEARGIRTPNLWVWNPTRCHCAIASLDAYKSESTPGGIRTHNPQIRSLMRYPVAPLGPLRAKSVENPGFDPGASSLRTTHSTD